MNYSILYRVWICLGTKRTLKVYYSTGICGYNTQWDTNEHYKNWLKPFKSDNRKTLCTVCDKLIDLSNMGEGAIKSYMKGGKHVGSIALHNKTTMCLVKIFFSNLLEQIVRKLSSLICVFPHPLVPNQVPVVRWIILFLRRVLQKAERLWTLKLITSHQFYKSSCKLNVSIPVKCV